MSLQYKMPTSSNSTSRVKDQEARLTAQEVGLRAVREEVHTLAQTLAGFAEDTRDSIKELGEKIVASHKTNWAPIIGSAGLMISVVIAMVAGWGNGYIRDQGRLEEVQNKITNTQASLADKISALEVITLTNKQEHDARRELTGQIPVLQGDIKSILTRLCVVENQLHEMTGNRWTDKDHYKFAEHVEKDIELLMRAVFGVGKEAP